MTINSAVTLATVYKRLGEFRSDYQTEMDAIDGIRSMIAIMLSNACAHEQIESDDAMFVSNIKNFNEYIMNQL